MNKINNDIARLSATTLLHSYADRALSPVEVTRAVLDRINQLDPILNAYCLVDADAALAAALASERRWLRGRPRGLLDGVPTCIKDLVLTRGWPTLRGSRTVVRDQDWDQDAPCVARLREHGAVLLGKTTTPEFGWKGVTDSPLTGITRNPWNTALTPGGSSGGAAVAVATGMAALAVGTDGGGSIRIPAGFTGVFGIKPNFGRVPAAPLSPFGTVAHLGPITRSVRDAALMLTVMSEPDVGDWYSLPYAAIDFRAGLEDDLTGLRIAFSPDLGYAQVDPEIAALVADAVQVFSQLGADVQEETPGFSDPAECYTATWYVGAANLALDLAQSQRGQLDTGLQEIIAAGESYSLTEYLRAQNARAALGQHMKRFHQDYDLLLTPTLPLPAFAVGDEVPRSRGYKRWPEWTPFSFPFNLTGQPAASIPCGFTRLGLPAGLQIVGANYDESTVLRACRAFETVRPIRLPDPEQIATENKR